GADAEMHGLGTGRAYHRHKASRRRAADDRVVDHDDILASEDVADGIVLHLDLRVPAGLGRLNEGAADVVIADQSQLIRQPALFGEAERGRIGRVGDAEDEVRALRRMLLRQPPAESATGAIDRAAENADA